MHGSTPNLSCILVLVVSVRISCCTAQPTSLEQVDAEGPFNFQLLAAGIALLCRLEQPIAAIMEQHDSPGQQLAGRDTATRLYQPVSAAAPGLEVQQVAAALQLLNVFSETLYLAFRDINSVIRTFWQSLAGTMIVKDPLDSKPSELISLPQQQPSLSSQDEL